jgi:hypothetical protein
MGNCTIRFIIYYCELRRAITGSILDCDSNSTDAVITLGTASAQSGSYLDSKFLLGINTSRCNDMGLSMKGSACSNFEVLVNSTPVGGDQLIVLAHYDYIISFAGDGSVSKTQ